MALTQLPKILVVFDDSFNLLSEYSFKDIIGLSLSITSTLISFLLKSSHYLKNKLLQNKYFYALCCQSTVSLFSIYGVSKRITRLLSTITAVCGNFRLN